MPLPASKAIRAIDALLSRELHAVWLTSVWPGFLFSMTRITSGSMDQSSTTETFSAFGFRWAVTFCFFIALFVCLAQDPFHTNLTLADGLPSNQVYCALEDHEGFLWFGTDAGVARYDGVEFNVFSVADGLTDNEVIGLYEDSEFRIWFLTLNGRLSYWYRGEIINSRKTEKLELITGGSALTSVCEDLNGRLWFANLNGDVFRLDMAGDSGLFLPGNSRIHNVFRDQHGSILCYSGDVVERFNGANLARLYTIPSTPLITSLVTQMGRGGKAPLVLGKNAIYELQCNGPLELPCPGGNVDPLLHSGCTRDSQGNIWLFRRDAGIDNWPKRGNGFGPISRWFAKDKVNSVYEDRRGDHWFCTPTKGVFRVQGNGEDGVIYRSEGGEGHDGFLALVKGKDRVWIGSQKGNILSFRNNTLKPEFPSGFAGPVGRIMRIREHPDNSIWFAGDFGVFKWSPENPSKLVGARSSSVFTMAKSLCISGDGKVFTVGNGITRMLPGPNPTATLLGNQWTQGWQKTYCITEDADGILWTEGNGSLIAWDNEAGTEYRLPEPYASIRINDLIAYGRDSLAIATAGMGILIWSKAQVVGSINTTNGLCSDIVRRLHRFGDTLWCVTAKGVSGLKMQGNQVREHWQWTTAEGLPTDDIHDLLPDRGHLLIASEAGLCVVSPKPREDTSALLRPHLAHLIINDLPQSTTEPRVLLRTDDRCEIVARTLLFGNGLQIQYAYSLNSEEQWHTAQNGRILLDRLPQGVQHVEIRSRRGSGEWSAPLHLPIVVKPYWWNSRATILLVSLLGASALFFGLYYWTQKGVRHKLAWVRAQASLNLERQRIATDVHDDLGADLSRLLMLARQQEGGSNDGQLLTQGIKGSMEKIDEIIWSLDPRRDTLLGTAQFIEQQTRELCMANNLAFRTLMDLPQKQVQLSAKQRRDLMLFVREATRNAVKHAKAKGIRVDWSLENNTLHLAVEDDGIGFDPVTQGQRRNGLGNMGERAKNLGGRFSITSKIEEGTRVSLIWPIP
jgi:signal transduction histidine kinase/ligand-binding sensor domain-containing protein